MYICEDNLYTDLHLNDPVFHTHRTPDYGGWSNGFFNMVQYEGDIHVL